MMVIGILLLLFIMENFIYKSKFYDILIFLLII